MSWAPVKREGKSQWLCEQGVCTFMCETSIEAYAHDEGHRSQSEVRQQIPIYSAFLDHSKELGNIAETGQNLSRGALVAMVAALSSQLYQLTAIVGAYGSNQPADVILGLSLNKRLGGKWEPIEVRLTEDAEVDTSSIDPNVDATEDVSGAKPEENDYKFKARRLDHMDS